MIAFLCRDCLHDQAAHDARVDFGESEAAEGARCLHVIKHCNLPVVSQAQYASSKQVEAYREADAESAEHTGCQQPVGKKETLGMVAHIGESLDDEAFEKMHSQDGCNGRT